MINALRGYRSFLPAPWLIWIVCIVYPIIFSVGFFMIGRYSVDTMAGYMVVIATYTVLIIEHLLNRFSFAGLVARDTNRLEYLKVSNKGMGLLEKVIVVDQIRRFMTTMIILLSAGWPALHARYVIEGRTGDAITIEGIIEIALVAGMIIEVYTFLTRLFVNVNVQMIMVGVTYGITGFSTVVIMMVSPMLQYTIWPRVLIPVGLLIGYIVISYMTRICLIKKARASYYD